MLESFKFIFDDRKFMLPFLYSSFFQIMIEKSAPDWCLFGYWQFFIVVVRWVNKLYINFFLMTGFLLFLLQTDFFHFRNLHSLTEFYRTVCVFLLSIGDLTVFDLHLLGMPVIDWRRLLDAWVLNHVILIQLIQELLFSVRGDIFQMTEN